MINLIKYLLLIVLFSVFIQAQEKFSGFDLRLGAGITSLGTDDMRLGSEEIEGNYTFDKYWASSLSIAFGNNRPNQKLTGSYIQGNVNIFLSPFDNEGNWDGRIGLGLTYWDLNYTSYSYTNGILTNKQANPGRSSTFGYNIIVENSWLLTDRIFLGFKVYLQSYSDNNHHLGLLMFKAGIKI